MSEVKWMLIWVSRCRYVHGFDEARISTLGMSAAHACVGVTE